MIYIAGPYYHKDSNIIHMRMEIVYEVIAEFTKAGEIVVSPMLMHSVVTRYNLPNNFEYWGKYSLQLLSKCNKMYVITMDGWEESMGVAEEIRYCRSFNIPVDFISSRIDIK